ncbi:hypothetical protein H1R20_g718, partial [Candolleomyces eurysporus]
MGTRRPSCAGSGWPKLTLAAEGQPYWASRTGTWYAAQHPDVSNIHHPLYDEGIKRAGAAQILLTAAEAFDYTLANRLRPPNRASALRPDDFESLSPITFATADELKKKLKSLSKDNNPYRDQNRDAGFARGQFELNRVFYRLVQPHPVLDRAKYSLPRDLQLPPSARVLALTFNVWSLKFDTRAESERLRIPRILDVAFAEVEVPSFSLKPGSVQQYVLSENSGFIRDRSKETFEHLIEHKHVIGQRISEFLSQGSGPNIVLAYDKVATEFALEALGSELKGQTIRSLLPLDTAYSNYDQRKNRNRSRSRSPTRSSSISGSSTRDPRRPLKREESASSSLRNRLDTSEPSSTAGPKNVIIDAHNLFFTMMAEGERPGSSRPISLSARLGIDKVPRDGEWGAAHDVRLLVEIWKAMASGPIIDEQRATWPSRAASAASMRNAQLAPAPGQSEDEDFDPEEMDPNDYRPQASSVPAAATGQAAWGAGDESDYDSDEY